MSTSESVHTFAKHFDEEMEPVKDSIVNQVVVVKLSDESILKSRIDLLKSDEQEQIDDLKKKFEKCNEKLAET